jgi:hypothetical protein
MSVTEVLDIHLHQEDRNYYCGAACAQMVLASIGGGLLQQDDLQSDSHSHSTTEAGWNTSPDGLLWTINHRKPADFRWQFELCAVDNEDAISRKIIWSVYHHRVSPVALVFGRKHWIVVRGFTATAAPCSADDMSYRILDFYVNDPSPGVPTIPPPPHSDHDRCGSGGIRGVSNEHIAYTRWQSVYMTGVNDGLWSGRFLAICGGDLLE